MTIPTSLSYASTIIGFVSFSFTLLTWLGVYFSLIKALHSAPSTIPLVLGNLRQEIQSERAYMRRNIKQGDKFRVFPGRTYRKIGKLQSHTHLVNETLRTTWRDFRAIEAQFLMRPGTGNDIEEDAASEAAEASGSDEWIDEKAHGAAYRRRPGRRQSHLKSSILRTKHASLSSDRRTYYNTDLWHRVKWWYKRDDVRSLSARVQRLQIRRIERDLCETDELSKRVLGIVGVMAGESFPYFGPDGPDGGNWGPGGHGPPDDGGDLRAVGGHRRRSAARASGNGGRRRRRSRNGNVRELHEKEVVRVRDRERSPSERSSPARPPPSVSIVGRHRRAPSSVPSPPSPPPPRRPRSCGPIEYEVVNPGYVRVEYPDGRFAVEPGQRLSVSDHGQRPRSYSRERSPHEQRSRSVSRARSRSRSRARSMSRSMSRAPSTSVGSGSRSRGE